MIMCADFWQLHSVTGTFLASNPNDVPVGLARDMMAMFWGDEKHPDTIRRFWQLTELMRCDDPWYNDFLRQCRIGNLSKADYNYFHGLPTLTSPTKLRGGTPCACAANVEKDTIIGDFRSDWKKHFLRGCHDMASFLRSEAAECDQCRAERKRRHRVLTDLTSLSSELRRPPFTGAPALYTFNVLR